MGKKLGNPIREEPCEHMCLACRKFQVCSLAPPVEGSRLEGDVKDHRLRSCTTTSSVMMVPFCIISQLCTYAMCRKRNVTSLANSTLQPIEMVVGLHPLPLFPSRIPAWQAAVQQTRFLPQSWLGSVGGRPHLLDFCVLMAQGGWQGRKERKAGWEKRTLMTQHQTLLPVGIPTHSVGGREARGEEALWAPPRQRTGLVPSCPSLLLKVSGM